MGNAAQRLDCTQAVGWPLRTLPRNSPRFSPDLRKYRAAPTARRRSVLHMSSTWMRAAGTARLWPTATVSEAFWSPLLSWIPHADSSRRAGIVPVLRMHDFVAYAGERRRHATDGVPGSLPRAGLTVSFAHGTVFIARLWHSRRARRVGVRPPAGEITHVPPVLMFANGLFRYVSKNSRELQRVQSTRVRQVEQVRMGVVLCPTGGRT